METIFDAWRSYRSEVVPAGAPPVQTEECRRAFYAGARATFSLVLKATDEDDDGAEAALARLEADIDSVKGDLRI